MGSFVRCGRPALLVVCGLAGANSIASADPGPPQWLPGGGAFVIGDGNAAPSSPVEFWGAQWWKDKEVSGGPAPAAFKGFALDVDLSNGTFTSATGNGAPPPPGPLPGAMNVIVANSVVQSGSTVSGTITGVVVVSNRRR